MRLPWTEGSERGQASAWSLASSSGFWPAAPRSRAGQLIAEDNPELAAIKSRHLAECNRAVAAALATLEQRERLLLRLSCVERLSVDGIGAMFHVGRSTAARWVSRARERLHEEVLAKVRAELGIGSNEVSSVIRLMRSQLDISLPRLLSS